MFGRLMPREGNFFELFNRHADQIATGSHALARLMSEYGDIAARRQHIDAIDAVEKDADKVTHETVTLLHKTFITPFDRDDIHKLITTMDDILDLIQDVAESAMLYDLQRISPEAQQLADITEMCCDRVKAAVNLLENMENAETILKICTEIDRLESDADRVMRSAMSKLFRDESDVRQLIKLQGDLRTARSGDRQVRGRRERHRRRRARERMTTLQISFSVVVMLVVLALAFDFMNGFHDAANSIATIVSTGVLKPYQAVAWAALFNVVALFLFELKVAATIGKGIVDPTVVDHVVIFGALVGALVWNVITWWFGIPSSSSHALIGGLIGATIAKAGAGSLLGSGITKVALFIVISPTARLHPRIGADAGGILGVLPFHAARHRPLVPPAAAGLVGALQHRPRQQRRAEDDGHHLAAADRRRAHLGRRPAPCRTGWCCRATSRSALGTLFGGWRIVKTMGQKITKLKPVGGFCAEAGGAITLFIASGFGIPVSTTHTITGAIVGVGSSHKFSAVRWGLAGNIVWAWILTIPASALMAAIAWWIGSKIL